MLEPEREARSELGPVRRGGLQHARRCGQQQAHHSGLGPARRSTLRTGCNELGERPALHRCPTSSALGELCRFAAGALRRGAGLLVFGGWTTRAAVDFQVPGGAA